MRKVGGRGQALYEKRGGGEGVLSTSGPIRKARGGGGGGALHFRHDTPLPVSATGVGFVYEYDVVGLLAYYTLTKELYTSPTQSAITYV